MKKIISWIDAKIGKELAVIILIALILGSVAAHIIIVYLSSLQNIALRLSMPLALIVICLLIVTKVSKISDK